MKLIILSLIHHRVQNTVCHIPVHVAAVYCKHTAVSCIVSPDNRRHIFIFNLIGSHFFTGKHTGHIRLGSGRNVIPGNVFFDIYALSLDRIIKGINRLTSKQKALIQTDFLQSDLL